MLPAYRISALLLIAAGVANDSGISTQTGIVKARRNCVGPYLILGRVIDERI